MSPLLDTYDTWFACTDVICRVEVYRHGFAGYCPSCAKRGVKHV